MIPFAGPSYALALRKADVQRSVNLHLVGMETPGKAPFVLQSVPGYTLFATGVPSVRGCLTTNDRSFFVHGSGLYELSSVGALTLLGALATSTGPVSMAYGTSQLVMVDGPNGYVLTLNSNVFQTISSDGFYGSDTVTFFDNYFVFVRPDTGQFYLSAINDATTFDALDFATAESSPDNLVGTAHSQRRLFLFGTKSTEVWSDSGGGDFPMEREGTTIEVGCMAAHSIKALDNTIFWVGADENGGGVVYRLNGYQAQRISTQGIEQAIQASSDLSQAVAYAYQENGLTFYALNAPGLTSTWVYEVSTGAWHERCDLDDSGQFKADRGVCHTYAFGYHLIGCDDGTIVRLDRGVFQKTGDPLVRERTSPHAASPGLTFLFHDAFHLDCTTGDAPQGVDPVVELSYSDDSGATYSNPVGLSSGKVGERFNRLTWRRMGRSRDRVNKIRFADNANFNIVDAQSVTRKGTS